MGELSGFSLTKLALSRFRPIGREEEEEFCSPAATRVGVACTEARNWVCRWLAGVAVRGGGRREVRP